MIEIVQDITKQTGIGELIPTLQKNRAKQAKNACTFSYIFYFYF